MVSNEPLAQDQTASPFDFLRPYEFIRVTTFRKNGVGVPTVVWFAEDQGRLYVTTQTSSGKIKRIRNNPRVLLIPCDAPGRTLFEHEIEALASEVPRTAYQLAYTALVGKYGPRFEQIASNVATAATRTYFVIEPQ